MIILYVLSRIFLHFRWAQLFRELKECLPVPYFAIMRQVKAEVILVESWSLSESHVDFMLNAKYAKTKSVLTINVQGGP
jgi:hypothetical protein